MSSSDELGGDESDGIVTATLAVVDTGAGHNRIGSPTDSSVTILIYIMIASQFQLKVITYLNLPLPPSKVV